MREIPIGKLCLSPERLFLIAGPCVLESRERTRQVAAKLRELAGNLSLPVIFKSSYDKANRSSIASFRGPGLSAGLEMLSAVREEFELPVLSDVHSVMEAERAGQMLDVLQIPAFLSRQTDLLLAAGASGKAVNIKKGPFLAPEDMRNVVEKVRSTGNQRILLTERGSFFGYHNLVVDFRSIPRMRELGYPVVLDATHAVQLPSGCLTASGGEREFVPVLARAGVAAGADGLFLEVHPDPAGAPCDGPNMLKLNELESLLRQCLALREALQKGAG